MANEHRKLDQVVAEVRRRAGTMATDTLAARDDGTAGAPRAGTATLVAESMAGIVAERLERTVGQQLTQATEHERSRMDTLARRMETAISALDARISDTTGGDGRGRMDGMVTALEDVRSATGLLIDHRDRIEDLLTDLQSRLERIDHPRILPPVAPVPRGASVGLVVGIAIAALVGGLLGGLLVAETGVSLGGLQAAVADGVISLVALVAGP